MDRPAVEKRKVLIVEDDEPQSQLIEKLLESDGFTPLCHRRGEPVLKRDDLDDVDVAIIDLRLPDMDGVELMTALHQTHPDLRVIIHTGYASIDSAVAAVNERAFAYVRKAANADELMAQVHRACHQRLREHSERLEQLVRERTRELEISETRLRTFLRGSPDDIYVLSAGGEVEFTNRSPGRSSESGSEPRHYSDVLPGPVSEFVAESLEETLASGESFESELEVASTWYDVRLTRFLAGTTPSAMVVLTDVTSRKGTEEALRQSEERLRSSQKLEAVGRLAGGIAHDFNNLLTVIAGYAQVLMGKLEDEKLKGDVLHILQASDRGAKLTSQLLAFARRQPSAATSLDVNEVVQTLEPLLTRLMGEEVRFTAELDPDLPRVFADPGHMEQVLMNLAINARDAMPEGGDLTVETRAAELEGKEGYVLLTVSDTGTGMDTEVLERAFEPFFTTKGVGKGTGLGLSTVYGIVEQSDGHVALESTIGRGTRVSVYLPQHDRAVLPRERSEEVSETTEDSGETILVVEDEEQVRELMAAALERRGYRGAPAEGGAHALELCSGDGPEIDLVLTDVIMPDMDGPSLAARLKDRHPGAVTFFVSGYTRDFLVDRCDDDSDYHFLKKPFTAEILLRSVREALDGRRRAGSE